VNCPLPVFCSFAGRQGVTDWEDKQSLVQPGIFNCSLAVGTSTELMSLDISAHW
jgi:hypothetical protein